MANDGIKLKYSIDIKPSNANLWGTEVAKLSIVGTTPRIPIIIDGVIAYQFVNDLIAYKNYESPSNDSWNGSLDAADFIGATSVAAAAFQNNTEITSIILPTTVTSIDANAFSGATSLTTISALGATSIGSNAFKETTGILDGGIKLTENANINKAKAGDWGIIDLNKLSIVVPTSDSMMYIIIGASIGGLLLIALIIGIIVHKHKKRKLTR